MKSWHKAATSICFLLLLGHGSAQNTVIIDVTSPVTPGQDDLVIDCSSQGNYEYITSYTINKIDRRGNEAQAVQQIYSISERSITTTWTDRNLETRGNLSGVPLPSPTATMVLTVPTSRIDCTRDAVGYRCEYSAVVVSGEPFPNTRSEVKYVEINGTPLCRSSSPNLGTESRQTYGFVLPVFLLHYYFLN